MLSSLTAAQEDAVARYGSSYGSPATSPGIRRLATDLRLPASGSLTKLVRNLYRQAATEYGRPRELGEPAPFCARIAGQSWQAFVGQLPSRMQELFRVQVAQMYDSGCGAPNLVVACGALRFFYYAEHRRCAEAVTKRLKTGVAPPAGAADVDVDLDPDSTLRIATADGHVRVRLPAAARRAQLTDQARLANDLADAVCARAATRTSFLDASLPSADLYALLEDACAASHIIVLEPPPALNSSSPELELNAAAFGVCGARRLVWHAATGPSCEHVRSSEGPIDSLLAALRDRQPGMRVCSQSMNAPANAAGIPGAAVPLVLRSVVSLDQASSVLMLDRDADLGEWSTARAELTDAAVASFVPHIVSAGFYSAPRGGDSAFYQIKHVTLGALLLVWNIDDAFAEMPATPTAQLLVKSKSTYAVLRAGHTLMLPPGVACASLALADTIVWHRQLLMATSVPRAVAHRIARAIHGAGSAVPWQPEPARELMHVLEGALVAYLDTGAGPLAEHDRVVDVVVWAVLSRYRTEPSVAAAQARPSWSRALADADPPAFDPYTHAQGLLLLGPLLRGRRGDTVLNDQLRRHHATADHDAVLNELQACRLIATHGGDVLQRLERRPGLAAGLPLRRDDVQLRMLALRACDLWLGDRRASPEASRQADVPEKLVDLLRPPELLREDALYRAATCIRA